MRSFQQRPMRVVMGLALGLTVLAVAGGPALADTERGHHGLVGAHALRDTTAYPGARCDYYLNDANDGGAATVWVRPPRVWARNRTTGVDHQKVGWRVRLQQSHDYVNWTLVKVSSTQKLDATDSTRAAFTAKTLTVPFNDYLRVRVEMFWYTPGSSTSVQGRAVHAVDHYVRYLDGAFEDKLTGNCPQDLTDPI